ncbi:MAG: ABC transporter permease [Methanoregulaceae archaeon]|jgi:lipopolysaccharide transport system permease protein|nr:ABC transporter permease [Methanoregulaceae archaeon]
MWITEYRDLISILTVSDLRVKYQSSVLGFAWSLVNPLLMMLVLYVVFSNVFHMSENQYALYILIGIVSWRFLQNGSSAAMSSIVGKPGLVTKVYIPRQILVLSSVLSVFISSLLEFLVLICLLVAFGVPISFTVLLFPFVHLLFLFLLYGLSLGLASLYVYYRDLNQIWEVLLQAGFFLCPIVYPLSTIPEQYLPIYMLNPITDLITIYRDIFLYGQLPSPATIAIVVISGVILFSIGRLLFDKLERRFAEEV